MKDEDNNCIPLTNGGDTPIPLNEENNFNTPDNFIQSLKLSQGHKSRADALLNFFCWFFSFVVWVLIGLIVYYNIYEENEIRQKKCKISFVFYYIVDIIMQLKHLLIQMMMETLVQDQEQSENGEER